MPWYVIHVYSGQERKVKPNLEQKLRSLGLTDKDFKIYVPTQEVAKVKDGKKKITTRTFFPGYILIYLKKLDRELWHHVKSTPGVIGFVGAGPNPTPLTREEIKHILEVTRPKPGSKPAPAVTYSVGDKVRVIDGPFAGFPGEVSEVDEERQKLRLMISIFGRSTPIELDFFQVEKI